MKRHARMVVCVIALLCTTGLGQDCPTHVVFGNDGLLHKLDCKGKEVGRADITALKNTSADLQTGSSKTEPAPQDPAVTAKRIAWDIEYIDYQMWALKHTRSIFFWQHVMTQVISLVVLAMVLAGFYFASVQFQIAKTHTLSAKQETIHEMKLSLQGFSVKTSALGVVILVASMAFFFLYIRYVYPIQPLSSGPDAAKVGVQ